MPRSMLDAPILGKRLRRRRKTKWKDPGKRDMESVRLTVEDALERTTWKNDIHNHSGDPQMTGNGRGGEEEEGVQ